jgi:hypothetical protein
MKDTNEPDLEKLRRFSLVVALVVITYSVAGIRLEPNTGISVIGMTFKVSRPDLLPIGLVMASVYALLRFYYYGFMHKKSPYRVRRDALDGLENPHPRTSRSKGNKISVYFGQITTFDSSISMSDREKVETYCDEFPNLFPKFARAKASARLVSKQYHNEEGEPYVSYTAKVEIPIRCRLVAIFQDIDYSSPIWLNLLALSTFFYRA